MAVRSWHPDCLIFPGHDFAKENLEFALTVEPDNVELTGKYVDVCDRRLARLPAVSSIRKINFSFRLWDWILFIGLLVYCVKLHFFFFLGGGVLMIFKALSTF